MAITINGVAFANGDPLPINGVQAQYVTVRVGEGAPVEAWRNIVSGSLVVTYNRSVTAGIDFPADTLINICLAGAGGSGSVGEIWGVKAGGMAGGIISSAQTYADGTVLPVVIGVGGAAVYNADYGLPGTNSTFDGLIGYGGPGGNTEDYLGNGNSRNSCGGTFTDGWYCYDVDGWSEIAYGGQAGAFGNGGNGICYANGGTGGIGAGGGSAFDGDLVHTLYSGAGGRGQLVLSWGS